MALAGLAGLGSGQAPAQADASLAARAPAERAFDRVVVFGDSLVDAGNVHLVTGGRRAAAAQGYVAGRFTNGFTFADRIAAAVEGRVTSPSRSGGNNYAYGGARALADEDGIPDAMAQVEEWRKSRRRADPRTLFILAFGGNDLRRPRGSGADAPSYRHRVARSYAGAVRTLFASGARTVLVTGAPIPSAAGADLQRRLDAEFDRLHLAAGQRLLRYDFLPLWRRLLDDAPRLGFRPWTAQAAASAAMPGAKGHAGDDCLRDRAQPGGCAGYVLFDRVHPTAAVHALIAGDIAGRLKLPVAEPPPAAASRWKPAARRSP
jgi:phospholipase/lecithinase/hemolysin